MTLDLDPATEARLQRQLARGPYTEPSALITHLLELAEETEQTAEDWLLRNRDAIRADLDESFAAEARGESYSMEEAEAILAQRRAARAAQAT
jgi:Arc/MetJ-type ribon-helix-helix transcriptional regulator